MATALATWLLGSLIAMATGELLQNGGFESTDPWYCWNSHCTTSNDKHSGQYSLRVSARAHYYDGPTQYIHVIPGHIYRVSAWIKVLNDNAGQNVDAAIDFQFTDGTHEYHSAANHANVKTSDGWFQLHGSFAVPTRGTLLKVRLYFQSGPSASVSFLVDDASVTELEGGGQVSTADLNHVINQHRKSDIHVHVTTASGINKADVKIHVLQKKKSFPFGTAVNCWKYNANAAEGKYRDFIHQHFNWVVPENALKWMIIEPQRGHKNYQVALNMIHGVKRHGLKVRGHNLVWSMDQYVQDWIKQLSDADLRNVVRQHIEETMNKTRGLLEHWDVNNEILHGHWYQTRLNDSSYNLELFREAHRADPNVKLFLNEFNVVANGASTYDYLAQAKQFKAANVGLYGIGVQCHFGIEQEPNTALIKQRLDLLAQAGVPIWVTELDTQAQDENRRADFYEKALRSFYGHPAVEGILFWGFWDQVLWRGEKAALVRGDNLEPTAAGRRVLDLLENQWMTDETHVLTGNQLTVRGFHGDYEVLVIYQGKELGHLKRTFTLGKGDHSVRIHVHTT